MGLTSLRPQLEQREVELTSNKPQSIGNLKMGEQRYHGYTDWGKEAHIVDNNEQLRTAYDQVDFIQKIRFDASEFFSCK